MGRTVPTPQPDRVTLWRADDLGAAELLRGRFVDHRYDPHAHDTLCLAVITGGALRVRARGTDFVATKGDVVAIDAETVHAGGPADGDGWKMRTLHVRPTALAAALAEDDRSPVPRAVSAPLIRDRVLAAGLFGVHACSERNGPALKRAERYLGVAARLYARHAREPWTPASQARDAAAVHRARDFIDDQLERALGLDEIAAAAGLPRFRLLRSFVRAVGLSPHAYQRQARVRLAAALIRRGVALAEIAAASGFADQAHLTRSFRRVIGVTPGVYRGAVSR